jgi:redox-sensitive bicupin YhaK (pirin superfamily)
MRVIHFTRGATDPLTVSGATGASFLPLADGEGDTHISCLHLERDGKIEAPSISHAAALLVVHGRITITGEHAGPRNTKIHAGMGIVVGREEPYSFKSESGAILLIVESQELTAHARAISTPQRIEGATWPSDGVWNACSEEITK